VISLDVNPLKDLFFHGFDFQKIEVRNYLFSQSLIVFDHLWVFFEVHFSNKSSWLIILHALVRLKGLNRICNTFLSDDTIRNWIQQIYLLTLYQQKKGTNHRVPSAELREKYEFRFKLLPTKMFKKLERRFCKEIINQKYLLIKYPCLLIIIHQSSK